MALRGDGGCPGAVQHQGDLPEVVGGPQEAHPPGLLAGPGDLGDPRRHPGSCRSRSLGRPVPPHAPRHRRRRAPGRQLWSGAPSRPGTPGWRPWRGGWRRWPAS